MTDTDEGTKMLVQPGAGASYLLNGEQATVKLSSDDTHGAYALVELKLPPQAGPPPHIHHAMEESFYVLDGQMEFVIDSATITAPAGSVVRIPRGTLRGYQTIGAEPARAIVLFVPGGFEGFLQEMGQPVATSSPADAGQIDVEQVVKTAAKYGCEIPPPPGTP